MDLSAIAQGHPLLWGVAVSVITGLAASAAYQLMAFLVQKGRMRSRFAHFEGKYEEFVRQAGASPKSTGGMIVLTYEGATKFKTEAFDGSGRRFWRGEIFMRPEVPVLGEGFYSHDGRDDTGIHRVLFNPEANHFNVSGANTSHPEGVKDFKTIWRRKSIGSASISSH